MAGLVSGVKVRQRKQNQEIAYLSGDLTLCRSQEEGYFPRMTERGSQLDLNTEPAGETPAEPTGRFLGVTFACCGIYARIYPNRTGDAYEGRCPRCLAKLRVGIGPGGSSNRFFTAS